MAESNAKKIADFILCFCAKHGDLITNLKLQKLLYYSQAWHLAIRDEPLFDDPIEAWIHGPVQPAIYHAFKKHGLTAIPAPIDLGDLGGEPRKVVIDVLRAYGRFSAFDLEGITHRELPWKNARRGIARNVPCHNVISHDDMRAYYRKRLKA